MSKTASTLHALPKGGEIESSMSQFAKHDRESCGVDASGHVRIAESPSDGVIDLVGLFGGVSGIGGVGGIDLDLSPFPSSAACAANGDSLCVITQSDEAWGLTPSIDRLRANSVERRAVAAKVGVDAKRRALRMSARAQANLRSARKISALRFDRGVENLFDNSYCLSRDGDDLVEGHGHSPTMSTPFPCVDRSAYAS
jgi:hypothetical protein